jgi:hypothetical protein
MKIFEKYPKLKPVLMCLLILVAAPFALELLIFLEFGGIEVAFTCLMMILKPFTTWATPRLQAIKDTLAALFCTLLRHPISNSRVYFTHVTASLFVLFVTSSLFLSVFLWVPALIYGGQFA